MRLLLIFSYFKTVATLVNYTSKSFIKLTTAVFEFKRTEFFYFSRRLFAKHHTLNFWCRLFSIRSRSCKIWLLSISKFFVYCCHGDLLKTTFWQTSIQILLVVKISYWSDKDKITFKTIEKYRYGVRKTASSTLNGLAFLNHR